MDINNKNVSHETPPVTNSIQKQGVGISQKSAALMHLLTLYRTDREGLFWVLNQIKTTIQNDEASHLADALIRRVKNAKPKA
jgi:hypothetical protein